MAGVRSKPLSSGKHRGFFVDMSGKQKLFTGTASKAETLRMAQRLEDEHRQIRLGYRPAPASADRHRARPFAEVAAEYQAWGESQGGRNGRPWSKTHANERRKKLAYWRERLGLETLGDLDGILPRVEEALRELQAKELAGKTLVNYSEALKAFCIWCLGRGYLAQDPLTGLVAFDKTPQSRRRALTTEEIKQLLDACAPHRRLAYEVAFCSGLRKRELRHLEENHLDTRRGGLMLDGAWTKNRKDTFLPLPADLVARLGAFAKSGEARTLYDRFTKRRDCTLEIPEPPLLYVPAHAARDLYKDMESTDIKPITPDGKADFHACRSAYITMLFESGADPKTVQALARHASPNLTFNVYAKTRPERLSDAVEAVGKMLNSGPEKAHSRHKMAAGAETLDVNAADKKASESAESPRSRVRAPYPPPHNLANKTSVTLTGRARCMYEALRIRTRARSNMERISVWEMRP